jgi:hypothetical protein
VHAHTARIYTVPATLRKNVVQNVQEIHEETDSGGGTDLISFCCAGTSHGAGRVVLGSGRGDNGHAATVTPCIKCWRV